MKLIDTKATATEVISHDVAPLTVNTDARVYSKLGWIIVLVGVLGFLLWATFAPLDKGVPMPGNVAKEGNRKSIQHQNGGTVEDILVKEGDTVKQGQVLVRMNGVQVKAQAEITKVQLISTSIAQARLMAERDGKSTFSVPEVVASLKDDPRVVANMALQSQLMSARQIGLQNELAAMEETAAGLKFQLNSLQAVRESKQQQGAYLKEQLDNVRDLAKDGYVARSKLLDLERNYVQLNGELAENAGAIGRTQRQIAEMMLKRSQRSHEYQREIGSQLADVQKEAQALESRLKAESYAVDNIEVKSPVDGVVIGMAVFTKGGVVQSGFRMMDVVPLGDTMIVEGRLPVNLVDKVHAGLPTELIFSAFNSNTTPHIPGVVTKVSPDRLIDDHTGQPYYTVQARVTPAGLKEMQQHKLEVRPGMPVELFVKMGERTMMSYLLKPVLDRAKTSMSEE
ncbi:HlyD family type I secretion periplasmic adaptor subunit [Pseudoduganella aquatica]|uniref:Membrane fusion protein (MFP) family protein n=1 Tax=Pseudoduganella aquatica TaxID=2660641 RepID=A0A7X4HEK7_9BURK|nr:HlyD family type I secretion periplasmic adaptor subunit [Pseudoduganella aquatica]MYN09750.1 HlyD family type I secretion periplasmic adaptor subunit [Pseudoduganella aquatica]